MTTTAAIVSVVIQCGVEPEHEDLHDPQEPKVTIHNDPHDLQDPQEPEVTMHNDPQNKMEQDNKKDVELENCFKAFNYFYSDIINKFICKIFTFCIVYSSAQSLSTTISKL